MLILVIKKNMINKTNAIATPVRNLFKICLLFVGNKYEISNMKKEIVIIP